MKQNKATGAIISQAVRQHPAPTNFIFLTKKGGAEWFRPTIF
jgi:hypothetical protein